MYLANVKQCKLLLLLTVIYLGIGSINTKRVNCRKYVFAPVCRGVAAKRDIPGIDSDISGNRNLQTDENQSPMENNAKKQMNEVIPVKTFLEALLRKINHKDLDYDFGNGNYY